MVLGTDDTMNDLHSQLAEEQLKQLLDGSPRIIVVHPNYLTHRFLLNELITHDGTVYIRWEGDTISEDELKIQFDQALTAQTEETDLSNVKNLVLDECDRVDETAFRDFLQTCAQTVVKENAGRVIVLSRKALTVWNQPFDGRDVCTFVPTAPELLLCNYMRDDEPGSLLEVHAFGSGRVYLNGREINSWDGVLPRSLFFYLVDRGMTTRDEIFKVFWPTLTTKEATNVFHVTKRKINEVLGVDLTMYWSGFYRISPDIDLSYDVMTFSKMVQDSAVAPPEEAKSLLQQAIYLYRGDFLTSLDLNWTKDRRQALLQTYGEALVSLAKISQDAKEIHTALGLYLRSALTNPQREDLVYDIMTLYSELDMVEDALLCYERLQDELSTNLDLQPTSQLQEFAASLRQQVAVAT